MHSQLLRCLGLLADAQAQLLQPHQVFAQLRGRPLGRRPGIVQLVHQPGRQRSQRNQLFAMQRLCLVRMKPLRHIGQYHLAHRRAARHQGPELPR